MEDFRIDYFGTADDTIMGGTDELADADWQDEWIQRSAPPLAIRIHMTSPRRDWPDMLVRLPPPSRAGTIATQ